MTTPQISIIIPALNEAESLPLLIPRIAEAMKDRRYEVLVVDDNSPDNTAEVCAELARHYPVELLIRKNPTNGLSGAVLHGMAAARGELLAVMDADLQHPPERLAALIEPLEKGEADFVIGSRYVKGGSTEMEWGMLRKLNSRIATWLARPFAGDTSDPMSGFFALRRSTYQSAERLTPLGYKIALELMCKGRVRNVREIPIHFSTRQKGQSKLTMKQQFRYLEHLSRLYDFRFPRASPIVKFLIATAGGWLMGLAIYLLLRDGQAGQVFSSVIAYIGGLAVTIAFHIRYVRTQREFLVRPKPWRDFVMISLIELAVCALSVAWLARPDRRASDLEVFIFSFGCATVARYVLRKELMADIRGLRREVRRDEML